MRQGRVVIRGLDASAGGFAPAQLTALAAAVRERDVKMVAFDPIGDRERRRECAKLSLLRCYGWSDDES